MVLEDVQLVLKWSIMVRTKSKHATKDEASEFGEIYWSENSKRSNRSESPRLMDNMDKSSDSNNSSSVRVGGRVKKAKQIFDPSHLIIPKKRPANVINETLNKRIKLSSPVKTSNYSQKIPYNPATRVSDKKPSEPNAEAKLYNKPAVAASTKSESSSRQVSRAQSLSSSEENLFIPEKNKFSRMCLICLKNDPRDELLKCSMEYCEYKAHLACIKFSNDEFDLKMLKDHWQCPNCKACVVCYENADAGHITICETCGDAYHSKCHTPAIKQESVNWNCIHCENTKVKIKTSQPLQQMPSKKVAIASSTLPTKPQPTIVEAEPTKSDEKPKNNKTIAAVAKVSEKTEQPRISDIIIETPPPSQPLSNTTDGDNKEEGQEFVGFSDGEPATAKQSSRESSTSLEVKNLISAPAKRGRGRPRKYPRGDGLDSSTLKYEHVFDEEMKLAKAKENEMFHFKKKIEVPDASKWSCTMVHKYFAKYFPEHAHIFADQEIDGSSLLLMKRSDVIHGLNLKLGPAVKIYRHVLMLQTRDNDPSLSWF